MKKFKVSYNNVEEDLCHVWVEAFDVEGAKIEAKQEYWDIVEIIQVIEMK